MKILLKNCLIKDPVNNYDGEYDILISKGKIKNIDRNITEKDCNIIDIQGKIVIPGLVDIHTHLREPGYENKETIKTGCEAAAAGGFTKIACMANTNPVIDNVSTVEFIKSKAREAAVKVFPVGSITKNLEGKELSEMGFMAEAGVKAISDDGKTVMNTEIMRRAMEYAGSFGLTIIDHCEDINLVGQGVMHEGYYSTILGLKPIPAAAEEIIIGRDIILSQFTGTPIHIAHLSTKQGLKMVEEARNDGVKISCEVTPHHLLLTDKAVKGYDTNTKVNPPLRSEEDRQVLIQGLKDHKIDVIATDHAPHTYEDKLGEYNYAANGISGLETALSLIYTNLIKEKVIGWEELVKLMVYNPADILQINTKGIKTGETADITIFDPQKEWNVDPQKFKSKGKNTPFTGDRLSGKVELTMVDGKIVYDNRGDKHEIIY